MYYCSITFASSFLLASTIVTHLSINKFVLADIAGRNDLSYFMLRKYFVQKL